MAGPWGTVKRPHEPLFESRSPPEYYPANPSRPAGADRLLSWASRPFSAQRNRRSTYHGLSIPATFRPQGLTTLSAACSLRARAGSVSHRRRSWDSPFGAFPSRKVPPRFHEDEPTYCFACRFYRRRSTGPARQAAVSGLSPLRESLATRRGVSARATGCSLGFYPSRAYRQKPGPSLRPASSHALRQHAVAARACASESQSASAWLCLSAAASRDRHTKQPF